MPLYLSDKSISVQLFHESAICTSVKATACPTTIHQSLRPIVETPEDLSAALTDYISVISIVDANEAFLFLLDLVNDTESVAVTWCIHLLPPYRDYLID
ncbi:hypothetical protein LOAG_05707 [Loa loa]|uniref:Uncharacterized protein n=1 Tax=Loa loa TaxID=7209 RepID=A0A1S0TZF7_LOALO|nr:hypothetical protein LOAG_05707 [Loa loa]EFO22772.2 hypothetical protein LOAG_05707 [Loa loa]